MIRKIERLERRLEYRGHIIDLYTDVVKIPGNGNIREWDFIGHKGAAAVLPEVRPGRVMLVKQYRNALDRITIEIPAGGLEPGEPTLVAAARELEEETGFVSDDLTLMMSLNTTVAFCNEKIDVYLAKNLKEGIKHPDEDEEIEICEYDIDELCDMISKGIIMDSKTVAALLAYKNMMNI